MEELFQVNPSIFHRPGRLPGFVDQVFPHWDMLLKFVAGQISVALVEALGQNMWLVMIRNSSLLSPLVGWLVHIDLSLHMISAQALDYQRSHHGSALGSGQHSFQKRFVDSSWGRACDGHEKAFETPVVALKKSNIAGWKRFFIAVSLSLSLGFMVKSQVMWFESGIGALDVSTIDLQHLRNFTSCSLVTS